MTRTLFCQYSNRLMKLLKKSRAALSKFIAQTISRILLPVWKSWMVLYVIHRHRRSLEEYRKTTNGSLLSQYTEIDWKGAKGFRDIIAHHYFDIDAEEVFWICAHEVAPLSVTIKKMIEDLR